MNDTGYDVRLPLMRMGKLLNAFYWGIIDENNPVIWVTKILRVKTSKPYYVLIGSEAVNTIASANPSTS